MKTTTAYCPYLNTASALNQRGGCAMSGRITTNCQM